LLRVGIEAGLDEGAVADLLASNAYADEVRADEASARELGIDGVPCFVLDGRFAVTGAQSPQVLLSALHHAWSERQEGGAALAEGTVCGPDGC
jgi:predicted DsbA family dithiol-disulfide isomerase